MESRGFGGFLLAITIGVSAIVMSLPLGIILALARQSDLPIVKGFAEAMGVTVTAATLVGGGAATASAQTLPSFIPQHLIPAHLAPQVEGIVSQVRAALPPEAWAAVGSSEMAYGDVAAFGVTGGLREGIIREIDAYRIAQEALANVAKHARARRADVALAKLHESDATLAAVAEECPRGCTHLPDAPDCAIVEAVAEGRLGDRGAARLDSLQRLLQTFADKAEQLPGR